MLFVTVRNFSVSFAIAIIALMSACSDPTSAEQGQSSTVQKWYQGGTLHQKTAAEWVKANNRERLATSGDFATAALKRSILWDDMDSPSDVRPYAEDIKKCIDTTYGTNPPIPELKNSETATVCWMMLYSHLMK